jgi:hypothetical protein
MQCQACSAAPARSVKLSEGLEHAALLAEPAWRGRQSARVNSTMRQVGASRLFLNSSSEQHVFGWIVCLAGCADMRRSVFSRRHAACSCTLPTCALAMTQPLQVHQLHITRHNWLAALVHLLLNCYITGAACIVWRWSPTVGPTWPNVAHVAPEATASSMRHTSPTWHMIMKPLLVACGMLTFVAGHGSAVQARGSAQGTPCGV